MSAVAHRINYHHMHAYAWHFIDCSFNFRCHGDHLQQLYISHSNEVCSLGFFSVEHLKKKTKKLKLSLERNFWQLNCFEYIICEQGFCMLVLPSISTMLKWRWHMSLLTIRSIPLTVVIFNTSFPFRSFSEIVMNRCNQVLMINSHISLYCISSRLTRTSLICRL